MSDGRRKDDTNAEVILPTTHGQSEGSLVRPFMSKRQRKNSLPDTRSKGGEGWGEGERERGWEAGEGEEEIKKEGGGREGRQEDGEGGGYTRRKDRVFLEATVVGVGCVLILKTRLWKDRMASLLQSWLIKYACHRRWVREGQGKESYRQWINLR